METFLKTAFPEVTFFYPITRILIAVVALILASGLFPDILVNFISVFLIITIGLMHGATDHILFINSSEKKFTVKVPKEFLIKYILVLVLMGGVWLVLPTLALIIFLLVSAYHFGQTQLQYIDIPENSPIKKLLYSIWGALVLSLIVLLNYDEAYPLISSAVSSFSMQLSSQTIYYVLVSLFAGLLISMFAIREKLSLEMVAYELVELAVIGFIAYESSLLVSFGIFFSLWHSLRASQIQIDKVSTKSPFNMKVFVKESLPFTLISIFGIALMILLAYYFQSSIKAEMLFLVAISMLTLPHVLIYEQFYDFFDKH